MDDIQKISAIVPVASWDFERVLLLLKSLKKNFDPGSLDTLFIIFPEKKKMEVAIKQHQIPFNIRIMTEKDVVPSEDYPLFSKQKGWYRQQIMKLYISKYIDSQYYICLDSDVLCIKPTSYGDLVKNGKVCVNLEAKDIHARWWQDSLKVLKVSNPGTDIGMTSSTNILIKNEVLLLIEHVEKLYNKSFIKSLFIWKWVNPKFALRKWTEYKLYWLFIEYREMTSRYNSEYKVWGKSIWRSDNNVIHDRLFKNVLNPKNEGHFAIVQGNIINDKIAIEMAQKYLGIE